MTILYKYLIKEMLKYFGIVLAMVIGIYLIIDFFEKIDDFLEAGVSFSGAYSFFLLKIPLIVAQIIPVCILLAVIIVFGLMVKNNELVALKSSGASVYYLLTPAVILGFLFSILLFFMSEAIAPITIEKANRIWLKEVKKKTGVLSNEKNIWFKSTGSITHIKYYNPATKSIFGVTINHFDDNFRLIGRIDSAKGIFKDNNWVLYDIMEQKLNQKDENYKVTFYEEKIEKLAFLPEDLKTVAKKSEEMNFVQLYSYVKKVESEGYDAATYRTDLHAKISFPFVCVIMCMAGTGLAVKKQRIEGLPVKIAFGIGLAFLYWIFYSFCVSLGYGRMLPPAIAAWTANFIFLCFSIIILLNAD